MKSSVANWSVRAGLLGAVWLAATGHGCATEQDEGDFSAPPGFSEQQTQQAVLGGFNFLRDDQHQLRTSTSFQRQLRTRFAGHRALPTQDSPAHRGKLEAVFHNTYADGLTVSASTHPQASLRVTPVNAQRVSPRLRNDGALVAFEDAFPRVTSAYSGRESKLEEFLLIPTEQDIPTLAYDLHPGPDFDHIEEEEGRLWAYAKDGAGLFTIEPPVADDAAGKRVSGVWKLQATRDGYRITADIALKGLAFPVLLDPTFETPLWFRQSSGQPSSRAGAASTFDANTGCSVIFGGAISSNYALSQDLSVRCGDRLWKSGLTAATMPPKRSYAAMAHSSATGKIYVYGGYGETTTLGDLWEGTLTCSTPGNSSTCSVSWTEITVPDVGGPGKRYLHGMAFDGSDILVFGGIKNTGEGLRDTWRYNASANTWTPACDTCFGGAKGLYGFAYTTLVNGGTRSVYVSGGYDDPTSGAGNFLNSVSQWNGSAWVDVSGQPTVIPMNGGGGIQGGSPLIMSERYLHWMVQTGPTRLLAGSGDDASLFLEDAWQWNDRSGEGKANQWIRATTPLSSSLPNAPGRRESANAIYDENHKEVVLFGGLVSATGVSSNTRIYRPVERSFSFTQTCTNAGCTSVNLTATFPGLDETTTPKCSQMEAAFSKQRVVDSVWISIDKFNNATFSGGVCSRTITTARIPSTYKDFIARVRDFRLHESAVGCSSSAAAQETTGANLPACLTNGGEAYTACGGLAAPATPSVDCEIY